MYLGALWVGQLAHRGRVRLPPEWLPSVHRHFRLVVMSAFTLFSGEWGPHQFRSQSLDTSARSIFPEAGAVVLQLTMNVTE